jgi:hypothetical protein
MNMKKCIGCKIEKEFINFVKRAKNKDGYEDHCKKCRYGYEPRKRCTIEKQCNTCLETKLVEFFPFQDTKKLYRRSKCRKCFNKEREKRRKLEPKEKRAIRFRKKSIKRLYGITIEDYNKMLLEQNNKCKICNKPDVQNKQLSIDHCHFTGKVRGLLCTRCNTTIGLFEDDIDLMMKAINYLKLNS